MKYFADTVIILILDISEHWSIVVMKENIHPKYEQVVVHCGCGNTFETRSTTNEIHAEICSMCHPFYTGKQKFVDTAGRIERFQKKYGKSYIKAAPAGDKSKQNKKDQQQ